MSKNRQTSKPEREDRGRKARGHNNSNPRRTKPNNNREEVKKEIGLDTTRSNNPAWYFLDEKLADQVSQMAFQQLAGYPFDYDGKQFDVGNIIRVTMNPCPGVQLSRNYNTKLMQNSAINMAGFRLYSKLSAYTGRTQSYGPQDISTMMLAMGEVISVVEFIRRAFGVSYTMNMRNRSYPMDILRFGMLIDPTDLFTNLSNYRTQFNTIITLINQLPIPKNVAYFDKCASIYERIYLDSPSSMAQTIVVVPHTTWILDEKTFKGGTILSTTNFCGDKEITTAEAIRGVVQPMSYYLNILSAMVGALLNSSTLQVVYTDILNYASKVNTEFWKFDYLFEEYQVIPEYDANFLLQFHNATFTSCPMVQKTLTLTTAGNVTPFNDVYPDTDHNAIYYNPAFLTVAGKANGLPRTGNVALIDMLVDNPSVTDRVEVTRLTSVCRGTRFTPTSGNAANAWIDCALPDHYCVNLVVMTETDNLENNYFTSTINSRDNFPDLASLMGVIDWAPHFFEANDSDYLSYTGRYTGDLNYYTIVDDVYMRKLHDFVGLALYDIR